MEVFDWIADHWMYITSGGFILLAVVWLISVIFKTAWGQWKFGRQNEIYGDLGGNTGKKKHPTWQER